MSDVLDKKPANDNKAPADTPSGIHLSKPLDEMSMASINVVADAAAIIAQKKMEAAAAKMAAAQAAMDRLAAMKAGKPLPPKPEEQAPAVGAKAAEAPKPEPVPEPAVVAKQPEIAKSPEPPPAAPKPVAEVQPAAVPAAEAKAPALVEAKAAPVPAKPAEAPKPKANIISTDKPIQHQSGIVRLAGALRAKAADQAAPLPKITGKRSQDPIANHAGLGRPSTAKPRKIVTPGLIFLLALMTFYALYASGNLPQFDRWTDSVVNDAHAHNDQVVGGILGAGRYILIGGGILIVLVAGLLIKNYLHQKHNEEHEREFHTR